LQIKTKGFCPENLILTTLALKLPSLSLSKEKVRNFVGLVTTTDSMTHYDTTNKLPKTIGNAQVVT
jgi:hypothetical protein